MKFGIIFFATIALIAGITTSATVQAATIVVNQSPACALGDSFHDSINDGIGNASSGDEVLVCDGNYIENVEIYEKYDLAIHSKNGPAYVNVTASSAGGHVFDIRDSNGLNISGFTIKGATQFGHYGMNLYNVQNVTIENSVISNNWGGVLFRDASGCSIATNNISDNHDSGVRLTFFEDGSVTSNIIYGNGNEGICLCEGGNDNQVYLNQIHGNRYGIFWEFSSGNNLTSNYIYDNDYGAYLRDDSENNMITSHVYNNSYGIYLGYSTEHNSITSSSVYNNSYGIYLYQTQENNVTSSQVYGNYYGVYYHTSDDNNLTLNNISGNLHGVYLKDSKNNIIKNNTFTNDGIFISGTLGNCVETIENNTINGKNLYYLLNKNDTVLQGVDAGQVILVNSTNYTIKDLNISSTDVGVEILYSSYFNLTSDRINGSLYGVYIYASRNGTLRNNTLGNSSYNFGVEGTITADFYHDIDASNTVDGRPVYYKVGQSNLVLNGTNVGYLGLISCNNVTVENVTLTGNLQGALLVGTWDSNVKSSRIYGNRDGIQSRGSYYNNVTLNQIYNNSYGVYLYVSSSNNMTLNQIYNNSYGVYAYTSTGNTLRNNTLGNSSYNFGVEGTITADFYHDIDASNTVDGRPVYYKVGQSNLVLNGTNVGYLGLISCNNVTVENVTLTGNLQGALLVGTLNSSVKSSRIYGNRDGIYLFNSSGNVMTSNTIYGNSEKGIWFSQPHPQSSNWNNNITLNFVCNNSEKGVRLESSYNSSVTSNQVCGSETGISLYKSYNNTMTSNDVYNISSNEGAGIGITYAENNQIASNWIHDAGNGITIGSSSYNNSVTSNQVYDIYVEGIELSYCSDNSVISNNVNNTFDVGIELYPGSDNNRIISNYVYDGWEQGIRLWDTSDDNHIISNSVYHNLMEGIMVDSFQDNISSNQIYDNDAGITLGQSSENSLVASNDIYNNSHGINLESCENNSIHSNRIEFNGYGVHLDLSSSCSNPNGIYNNIFNNTENFYFAGAAYENHWNATMQEGDNVWNATLGYIGGNYWAGLTGSGYSDTCTDAGRDGFCDSSYSLAANNIDYLPVGTGAQNLKEDGESCAADSECGTGLCCNDACRDSCPFCGDDYCDSAESHSSCPADCPESSTPPGSSARSGMGAPYAPSVPNASSTPPGENGTNGRVNIAIPLIEAGSHATVALPETEGLAVREITIFAANSLSNVTLEIRNLPHAPAQMPGESGKIYSYISIEKGNVVDAYVSKVVITFAVDKSWMAENGAEPGHMALIRWNGAAWQNLTTRIAGEDASETLFESESPGLSLFAITALISNAPQTLKCPVCQTPQPWEEVPCTEGKQARTNYRCGTETNHVCQPYPEEQRCEVSMPAALSGFQILAIAALAIVIAVAAIAWKFASARKS